MQASIFQVIHKNNVPAFLSIVKERASTLEETDKENLENTVLHLATELEHKEIVSRIIKLRPSLVSSGNAIGDTPLHFAARLGDAGIVSQMLESEWAACTACNNRGQTALFFACWHKHLDVARLIVDKTGRKLFMEKELNAAILSGYTDIAGTILQKFLKLAWKADKQRSTPLHCACKRGDLGTTKMLLRSLKHQ